MLLTEPNNFLLYLNKVVILADTHQILFKYNKKLSDSVNSITYFKLFKCIYSHLFDVQCESTNDSIVFI